jgi:hypothetical protein
MIFYRRKNVGRAGGSPDISGLKPAEVYFEVNPSG